MKTYCCPTCPGMDVAPAPATAPVAGIRWRDVWAIDSTPLTSAGRPPQHRGQALVKPAEDNRPTVTPRHRAERERMSLRGAR